MAENPLRRAKEVFQSALDQPRESRAHHVAGACGEDTALRERVLALLAVHERLEGTDGDDGPTERPGDRIGRFRLEAEIGSGGFGTVWVAAQTEPVRRQVALKILKWGMDTRRVVARFEAERQALALMDHPHIAKVLDGGATAAGRPWFAMELVHGEPITAFCDRHGMPVRDRLRLFADVCMAVQHAHQKGVVHRDLKPGNVLVGLQDGRPAPKVIDFGIAKAIAEPLTDQTVFTEFRQMLGTPEYMAPEQVGGAGDDVDTRADVYSLGVLAYELVTGARPFERDELLRDGYAGMVRRIREDETPRPSTRVRLLGERLAAVARSRGTPARALAGQLHGDLDWIVLKALEKDRDRRYATAQALAEDVGRHLRHEPVQAGPPTLSYRLRKYLRRHRVGVGAAAVALLALAGGLAATALSYAEVRAQRNAAILAQAGEQRQRERAEAGEREARAAARKATMVVGVLQDLLASADPHSRRGPECTLRELLAEWERELPGRLRGEPEVEAAVRRTIARAWLSLGQPTAARPHLDAVREILRSLPEGHELAFESQLDESRYLHDQGDYAAAIELAGAAAAGLEALYGREAEGLAQALGMLSDNLRHAGRYEEARESAERAVAILRRHGDHPHLPQSLRNLGLALQSLGQLREAVAALREGLQASERLLGPDHPQEARQLNSLAIALQAAGESAEAEACYRRALDSHRRQVGSDHKWVASVRCNLAHLLLQKGKPAEAEVELRQALEFEERTLGADHPELVPTLSYLAEALRQKRELAEAERVSRRSLELARAHRGDVHHEVAISLNNRAVILVDQGDLDAAEAAYRESLAIQEEVLPGEHQDVATTLFNLATVVRRKGDAAGAESLLRRCAEMRRHVLGGDHVYLASSLFELADVLRLRSEFGEAAQHLRECVRIRELRSPDSPLRWAAVGALGQVLARMDDREGGERLLLQAWEGVAGGAVADRRPALARLVELYEGWPGREADAERWRALRAGLDAGR